MSNQEGKAIAESQHKGDEDKVLCPDAEDTNEQCIHCGNQPCLVPELETMLMSILDTYEGWKSKKQIRFRMYSDTIKFLHGPGLGKGVRKKLPSCLQRRIHKLVPDDSYTGFKATAEE